MKWRVRKPFARYRALQQWHKWFAWYPVRIPTNGKMSGMTMVWLQFIQRKGDFVSFYDNIGWDWQYRFIKK